MLSGLVHGEMPAIVINALLVVLPELLQLSSGILWGIHTHDNRRSGVPTVQRSNSADKRIVQFLEFRVTVLSSLDRLMIRGACGVGGNLPAVTAEIVVVLPGNLLLHQPKAAHDIPPDGSLQRSVYSGIIIDRDDPLVRKVLCCLPDCGIVILRACGDFHKGKIACLLICVCEAYSLPVGAHKPHCLRDVGKIILGKLNGGRYNLLDSGVPCKRNRLYVR